MDKLLIFDSAVLASLVVVFLLWTRNAERWMEAVERKVEDAEQDIHCIKTRNSIADGHKTPQRVD